MSTTVFYFGGFNASQNDIDSWVRSARQQKPTVDFIGFKWESGTKSWPADVVVKGAKASGQYKAALEAIQACKAETVYLVGHSSGCAVSNALDRELKDERINLVALDGFSPDDDQLKKAGTQVWGAICGKIKSKNFPGPSRGRRRIYEAVNCTELWSLHFSVVNEASADGKVRNVATGYLNCKANMGFLN